MDYVEKDLISTETRIRALVVGESVVVFLKINKVYITEYSLNSQGLSIS